MSFSHTKKALLKDVREMVDKTISDVFEKLENSTVLDDVVEKFVAKQAIFETKFKKEPKEQPVEKEPKKNYFTDLFKKKETVDFFAKKTSFDIIMDKIKKGSRLSNTESDFLMTIFKEVSFDELSKKESSKFVSTSSDIQTKGFISNDRKWVLIFIRTIENGEIVSKMPKIYYHNGISNFSEITIKTRDYHFFKKLEELFI